MIDFDRITPFSLVRGIGTAGVANSALYLLICEPEAAGAVENDLLGEIQVQLDAPVQVDRASELQGEASVPAAPSLRVLCLDQWLPELVKFLDQHSPLLVQGRRQLLLLAERQIAERLLQAAPNLRNRLTGIFRIEPEDWSAGGSV